MFAAPRLVLLRTLADAGHLSSDALPAAVTFHERVGAAKLAADFIAPQRELLRLESQHDSGVAVKVDRDVVDFPRRVQSRPL
jgi:hypothetical protein